MASVVTYSLTSQQRHQYLVNYNLNKITKIGFTSHVWVKPQYCNFFSITTSHSQPPPNNLGEEMYNLSNHSFDTEYGWGKKKEN